MARRPRQFEKGKIYHIIQRGHNRAYIFNEQSDKAAFLDFVRLTRDELPFHLLYYVLMDNHYHLVMEMADVPLDRVMQRVDLAYCRHFNRKYACNGTAFGGRYTCYPVTDRAYLVTLLGYIANNPVKAGLARSLTEYRWSAHLDLVATKDGIVSSSRLFELLGGTRDRGARLYARLIRQHSTKLAPAPVEPPAENGTEAASADRESQPRPEFFLEQAVPDAPSYTKANAAIDKGCRRRQLERLLEQSGHPEDTMAGGPAGHASTGFTSLICSRSKIPHVVKARHCFIREALVKGFTAAEIADLLGVSRRTIRYCQPASTTSKAGRDKAGKDNR